MNRLLITGEMRSGTTFLSNFLNSQENAIVYADFLRSLFIDGKNLKINNINKPLAPYKKNVLVSSLKASASSLNLDLSSFIDQGEAQTWSDLLNYSMDFLFKVEEYDKSNIKLLGIKKTSEQFYLKELLRNGYKIIYLIRDPRDVMLSSKNRFSKYNIYTFLNRWINNVEEAKRYREDDNFFFLKFEDLIEKKEITIKQLSHFLEVSIKLDMEKLYLRKEGEYTENSSFGDVKTLFDESALYRWKDNIDSDEVILTGNLCRKTIRELSYEENIYNSSHKKRLLKLKTIYYLKKIRMKLLG